MATPPTTKSPSPSALFSTSIGVRWRDLDAYNHVNNSTYLTYLEQARLAWLQGLSGEWFSEHSAPVMAACQLNYRAPINWPARLCVELTCERQGNSSMTIGHRIVDADDTAHLYCDGNITVVWINPATGKPVPLPDVIREAANTAT